MEEVRNRYSKLFPELPHQLKFRVLAEPLAVCQFAPETSIPAWVLSARFFCATRTADELSIVCPDEPSLNDRLTDARIERGWIALKLEGPFPFSMTGVLASFLQPLGKAEIPIFAISTFDTDYVLIKREKLQEALAALRTAGHQEIANGIPV